MEKKDKNEYADLTYEYVSSWINNCDSKASILLALMGVILSIAFTSDFILSEIKEQIKQVVDLIKGDISICLCGIIITFIILIILTLSIGYLICSLSKMIQVLYARLDDSRDKDNPSVCFFRSIAAKSFDEYKSIVNGISKDTLVDDKLHQVYDCSCICTRKFTLYNEGVRLMKIGLIFFAVFLLVLIINTSL